MPPERPRLPTREGLRARAQLEGAQVLLRGDAPPLALRRTLEGLAGLLERPTLDGPSPAEVLRAVRQALRAAGHPQRVREALQALRGSPLQRRRPDAFARLEAAVLEPGPSSERLTPAL